MKLLYLHYPFYLFTLYNHILHLHLTFILSLYFAFQISVVHLRLIYFLRLISTFYICVLRKYISGLPLAFMFFGLVLSPHLYLCFRSFRNSANSRALPFRPAFPDRFSRGRACPRANAAEPSLPSSSRQERGYLARVSRRLSSPYFQPVNGEKKRKKE